LRKKKKVALFLCCFLLLQKQEAGISVVDHPNPTRKLPGTHLGSSSLSRDQTFNLKICLNSSYNLKILYKKNKIVLSLICFSQ